MKLDRKKLIYILNNYSVNSTEHFFHVLNLLEEIAINDVDILLIIEKSDGFPSFKSSNIKVSILNKSGFRRLFELYDLIDKAQKENYNKLFVRISNWAAVTAIIKSFFSKLDVYYWHSGTVFGFDNEQPFNIKKLKWYFKNKLPFNFIKRFVTYFVTGPESMKYYYINEVGVAKDKIKILYNDINLSRFRILSNIEKNEVKKNLNIQHNKRIVLFVHNFSPVRKTRTYVSAFLEQFYSDQDLQDSMFYFIGGGKDKDDVEQDVISLGLEEQVSFLGSLPNSIVHQYYQIADFFINPTAAEGFPRVLIEAMACGIPIVTTNAGGIKDILGINQLEYMSDVADSEAFAVNLIKIAKLSSDKIEILKFENLERVKNYRTENVALMYIKSIFDE